MESKKGTNRKRRTPHDGESQTRKKKRKLEEVDKKSKSSSTFLDKMRARLSGGHFRMINEKLYTCTYIFISDHPYLNCNSIIEEGNRELILFVVRYGFILFVVAFFSVFPYEFEFSKLIYFFCF